MDYNPTFSPGNSLNSPSNATTVLLDRCQVPSDNEYSFSCYRQRLHRLAYVLWVCPQQVRLDAFVSSTPVIIDRDADWYKVDSRIVNWIYMT
jgi:hypothetical protein